MRNSLLTILGAALLASVKKSSGSASNFDVMLRRMGLQDGKIKIRVNVLYSPPSSDYDKFNPKLFLELPSWLEKASNVLEGMWVECVDDIIENNVDFEIYELENIITGGMADLDISGDELDNLHPYFDVLENLNNYSEDPSMVCFPENIEVISDTKIKDEYDFDQFCYDFFAEYREKASKIINDGPEENIKDYLYGIRRGHNGVFIDWNEFIDSEYWPETETKKSIVDGLRKYFSHNAEEILPNETYYRLWDDFQRQGFICDFIYDAKTNPFILDWDLETFIYFIDYILEFSIRSYNDYLEVNYSVLTEFGMISAWDVVSTEPKSLPVNKKAVSQLRRF